MKTLKTISALVLLLALTVPLGLSGCANQARSEAGALLAQDFRKMDNDELLLYYYRLTEEIDRRERSGPASSVGIGIGGGSWGWGSGGGSGVGVGVSTSTPVGSGGGSDELRNRRAEVRAEMQRRNMILPRSSCLAPRACASHRHPSCSLSLKTGHCTRAWAIMQSRELASPPVPMPLPRNTKKKAKSSHSESTKGRNLNDILGESRALKAWLRPGKGTRQEVFIILAEDLPPADREFLARTADLVVEPAENLPGRLAALARENRQLKSLSLSDDLTGLYNKRFFSIQLEIEMARSRRSGQPCCLMMIDFDNFKDINDRLGHDEGDRFLTQMGGLIRDKLRPTDFVCRYGGDEFAVIMPATSLLDGIGIARRLREFTAHFTWKMAVRVSASFGL
nr:GGDEF domain-containing protein [Syntrophales bacterium]